MKRIRIPDVFRAAAALLFLLAACSGDNIVSPRVITGNWLATLTPGERMLIEQRLELGADGRYTWTTLYFGLNGRPGDRLQAWQSRSGEWRMRANGLALRMLSGTIWQHGTGWGQLDSAAEWRVEHAVRMDDEDLVLTPVGPMLITPGAEPEPLVLRRVPNHDDAARP